MSNLILDFAVKFNNVDGIPSQSLGFLHNICVAVKIENDNPTSIDRDEVLEGLHRINSPEQLLQLFPTQSSELQAIFDGGLSGFYVVAVNTVADISKYILDKETEFYTLHNSSSFDNSDFVSATESWGAVKGIAGTGKEELKDFALNKNLSAMYTGTVSKNSYRSLYAFSSLLSSTFWRNQQYIDSNSSEGTVTEIGEAEELFDARVGFWLSDDQTGNKLGFFVAGGESITTPYIMKELETTIQSNMLNFLAVNEPFNVVVERAELSRIGGKVIADFEELGYLDSSKINVITVNKSGELFVVNGKMNVTASQALWRVKIEAYQGGD